MTTTWQERELEERAALDELGPQLAEALGTDWKAEDRQEGHWGVYLTSPGSEATARLFVSFDRSAPDAKRRERVIIYGSYPREWLVRGRDHEISVATKRGAETIAKEIKRRLLPDYLADLVAGAARHASYEASHAKARANADRLAAALGASVDDGGLGRDISVHWYGGEQGYADFRVSEKSIRIDRCSFPADKVQEFAEVLAR